VFPKPPPAESVVSCGDGGILGSVVGVMGVLQALEAVKLIVAGKLKAPPAPPTPSTPTPIPNLASESASVSEQVQPDTSPAATMLLFSSISTPPFRSVRLRSRRPKCFACSSEAGLSLESLTSGSLDYVLFCGVTSPINILTPEERIEARQYHDLFFSDKNKKKEHLLLDVREKVQFDICNLPNSINVPFSALQGNKPVASAESEKPVWLPHGLPDDAPIYVVCRLGNDSQVVARKLKESGLGKEGRYIGDIRGGLKAWREQVDGSWPEY
jgi:adenylyltransferase/sulfurtransferase